MSGIKQFILLIKGPSWRISQRYMLINVILYKAGMIGPLTIKIKTTACFSPIITRPKTETKTVGN